MNFEFLKDLHVLSNVYEYCCDAEMLAMTMPVQSMFTSRKSAELLAKFIYMAAHKREMESLDFRGILADQAVQQFIHNRDVMDAFHYIRKSGNRAVHGDDQESPEDAITVLQDLHFVAGETARRLRLIRDYPAFEDRIESYPNAVFVDEKELEEEITQKALKMFLAYVEEFNAQQERDQYVEQQDYDWLQYSVEGRVDMHEYLEFKRKPGHIELTGYLQDYLGMLTRLSVQRAPDKAEELGLSCPVSLDVKIIIGDKIYTSDHPDSFAAAIREELPKAGGFIIDCICTGDLSEYFNDEPGEDGDYSGARLNMIRKDAVWTGAGMLDKLESFRRRERFTYYSVIAYPDAGNVFSAAIVDGKTKDVTSLFGEDILAYPDLPLDCDGLSIFVSGEKPLSEYPELFEAFKAVIRENVSESNLHLCEEVWDPDDAEYIEGCLLPSVPIKARSVSEYEAFLRQMKRCLEPWRDELQFEADEPNLEDPLSNDSANILYNIADLSLAVVEVRDGRLSLTGTVFERR